MGDTQVPRLALLARDDPSLFYSLRPPGLPAFVGWASGVGARQNPFSRGLEGLEKNGRGWGMIFELLGCLGSAREGERQRHEQGWRWLVPPFCGMVGHPEWLRG